MEGYLKSQNGAEEEVVSLLRRRLAGPRSVYGHSPPWHVSILAIFLQVSPLVMNQPVLIIYLLVNSMFIKHILPHWAFWAQWNEEFFSILAPSLD